jgi:hypothetical protein
MAIPLIGNVGFTEVSSAGTLNDKAGTAKSKLPIQYFRLSGNISGNLTLNNDSAHKKIILDTNGNTITNSSGSPLTTNSSTTLELQGSGNVQSTLKTSTAAVASTSNTGTTVFGTSDSSQIVVTDVVTDTTVEKYVDTGNFTYNGSTIDSSGVTTVGGSTPNASTIFGSGSSTAYGINTTDGTQAARFIGDTSTSTTTSPVGNGYELYIATIGPNTVSILRMDEYANIGIGGYSGSVTGHNRYSGTTNHFLRVSGTRRLWFRYVRAGNDRRFVFTNNLDISCVLSGADPYDGVTVSAGATNTVTTTNSTDGSFDITMTISGNNGSSQPYALASVNSGSGSINTDAYSGTLSARAF